VVGVTHSGSLAQLLGYCAVLVCALVVLGGCGGLALRFLTPPLPWSKRGADPRGAAFFFLALRSDNPRCRLTYILGRTDILVYFE
jgi:hypothetical protein